MLAFQANAQKISELEQQLNHQINIRLQELHNSASPPSQERKRALESEIKGLNYIQSLLSDKNKDLVLGILDQMERRPGQYKTLEYLLQNSPELLVALVSMDERSGSQFRFKDLRINADIAERYANMALSKMKELGVLNADWNHQSMDANQKAVFHALLPQAYRGQKYLGMVSPSDLQGSTPEEKAKNFVDKFIRQGFLAQATTSSRNGERFHSMWLSSISHTASEFFVEKSSAPSKAVLDGAYLDGLKNSQDPSLQEVKDELAKIDELGLRDKFMEYAKSQDIHSDSGSIDNSKLLAAMRSFLSSQDALDVQKQKGKYANLDDFLGDSKVEAVARFFGFNLEDESQKSKFKNFINGIQGIKDESGLYSVEKLMEHARKYPLRVGEDFVGNLFLIGNEKICDFLYKSGFIVPKFDENGKIESWSLSGQAKVVLKGYWWTLGSFNEDDLNDLAVFINSKWNKETQKFATIVPKDLADQKPLYYLINYHIRMEMVKLGLGKITVPDSDDLDLELFSNISLPSYSTSKLKELTDICLARDADDPQTAIELFTSIDGKKVIEYIRDIVNINLRSNYVSLDAFLIGTYSSSDQNNAAAKFFALTPDQQNAILQEASQRKDFVYNEENVLKLINEKFPPPPPPPNPPPQPQ